MTFPDGYEQLNVRSTAAFFFLPVKTKIFPVKKHNILPVKKKLAREKNREKLPVKKKIARENIFFGKVAREKKKLPVKKKEKNMPVKVQCSP